MTELEGHSIEQTPQKPRTMTEHREEFTAQYEPLRRKSLDASWTDEEGQEKIGRVYRLTTRGDKNQGLDDVSQFVLKARQAGFRVVDSTDVPFADYYLHQFTLEGRPLSLASRTAPPQPNPNH